jgi:hypothetical protein
MATTPERIASALRLTVSSNPLWLDASGTSMGRAIRPGSEIQVVAAQRPRRGQVWAFCDDAGTVVIHRCRGRRGGRFVFEGDATGHADRPVAATRLVGRVAAVRHDSRVRRLGRADTVIGALAILLRRAQRRVRRARGRLTTNR